jgi:hypothetical protein
VGYWPMPFNTFLALSCPGPMTVRVVARLDNYYNYDFDRDEFLSFRLDHIDGRWIHGFVHRHVPLAKRLVDLLYDGNSHRVTVSIWPGRENTSHVFINGLVSDSWIVADAAT